MRTFWWFFYSTLASGKYITMKVYEIIAEDSKVTLQGSAQSVEAIEAMAKKLGLTAADKEIVKASMLSKMAPWLKGIVYVTGFVTPCLELAWHLTIIDKYYMNGKYNATEYKNWRQYYIGVWQIEILVPFIIMFIRRAKWITLLAGAIIGFLSGGTAIGIGAAILAAFGPAATEWIMIEALSAALQSPAGQEWLKKFFTEIAMFGKIGDEIWNELQGLVSNKDFYDKKKEEKRKKNPAAAAADDAEASGQQLTGKQMSMQGLVVLDKNGYKIPGIDIALGSYIKQNPNDPLVQKYLAAPERP
jgi:hypothetical protein